MNKINDGRRVSLLPVLVALGYVVLFGAAIHSDSKGDHRVIRGTPTYYPSEAAR